MPGGWLVHSGRGGRSTGHGQSCRQLFARDQSLPVPDVPRSVNDEPVPVIGSARRTADENRRFIPDRRQDGMGLLRHSPSFVVVYGSTPGMLHASLSSSRLKTWCLPDILNEERADCHPSSRASPDIGRTAE